MANVLSRSSIAVAALLATFAPACSSEPDAKTGDEANITSLDPKLEKAALENLMRIAREIDTQHLSNYGKVPKPSDHATEEAVARKFLESVKLEYEAEPKLLEKRVQTLASMVFFSAPEVETDAKVGHVTPFHGMDDAAFEALMANEDFVFSDHMTANGGSPNGVRPFSVCETTYLIEISTGKVEDASFIAERRLNNYDAYAKAYKQRSAKCDQRDLDEWYNFRGLGGLRPSWLESNYNDRILRQMLKSCKSPSADMKEACSAFEKDRLAFRDEKNIGLALREMAYDTSPDSKINDQQDGDYITNPGNAGVFVADRNGDHIAEWLAPGPTELVPGVALKLDSGEWVKVADDGKALVKDSDGSRIEFASASLEINSTGQFSGELKLTLEVTGGQPITTKVPAGAVRGIDRVDPGWKPELVERADLGLLSLFSDGSGCKGDTASDKTCPLIKRFYSMIDRHENFYQTYSSTEPKASFVSSQPSPLVACSITLGASHAWDHAGTPEGGTAGFIYLMRIPFAQIMTGDTRSIDTLGRLAGDLKSGPKVLTLQEIYEKNTELDMSKVWLDIATLSNNQYASEHEVSKFGTVPAEQIEGILVIRRPAAMGAPPNP